MRAERIPGILHRVQATEGELSLERLRELADDGAMSYLVARRGVGDKTAACVWLFGLGRPVFPVDTHVHRLAERLGWVAPGGRPARTQQALAPVPPQWRHSLHVDLIRHGRSTCLARGPQCTVCGLDRYCPAGQAQRVRM